MKRWSLLCKLIGHKWMYTRSPYMDELQELPPPSYGMRRVMYVALTHCSRCGEPNPRWLVTHQKETSVA